VEEIQDHIDEVADEREQLWQEAKERQGNTAPECMFELLDRD